MISVEEAKQIISSNLIPYQSVEVDFKNATGYVLDEDLFADRDFPPFNRVTMDGIAINYDKWEEGVKEYRIEAIQAAGSPQISLKDTSACVEVMTGAVLPKNTDCVIRYEDLEISDTDNGKKAKITIEGIQRNQNVHGQGQDRKQGNMLMKKGTLISPPDIGVITTIGRGSVPVRKLGDVAIIATGDELVDVNDTPAPHQIRMSNVYAIQAAIHQKPLKSTVFHLKDDREVLRNELEDIFKTHPIIILSGGVSKGKFDFVPGILEDLGVKKLFHRIAQRPGKPFWFGRSDNNVVFALPGNPVSAFMCYNQYFIPWYFESLGYNLETNFAELIEDFEFNPDLTYFLQVKLHSGEDGKMYAKPIAGHGSGDHANLLDTDAFLILPRGENQFNKGKVFPFIPFR